MLLNPEADGDNGPRSRPVAFNDQDWAVLQVGLARPAPARCMSVEQMRRNVVK